MNQEYSEKVMEHFRNPRNVGVIENADGTGHVGNPMCVVPQTLIYKNSSIESVKHVKKGTRVLSHDGFYHNVEKVYKRFYKGLAFNIDVHNLGNLMITPHHHILALKTNRLSHKHRDYKKCIRDWRMSVELKKGDTLLLPIPKEIESKKYIDFDIPKPKWDHKSQKLPRRISINDSFLRLIGYYLAEGSVITKACKGQLTFSFGAHEHEYINDVINIMKRIFGLEAKIKKNHNALNIYCYSARLARFFKKNFGTGAKNKRLPHWALLLPIKKQKALICGLWRGDGHIAKRNGNGKFVTISKTLAHQLKILLMRQKIIFSYLTVPERGMHKENYCIYIRSREAKLQIAKIMGKDSLKVPPRKAKTQKAWYDDDHFYATVDKVKKTFYHGLVYNLGVEGSHSYVSEAATLHNCGDIMEMYIKVENDVITDAKFKTFGCGAAIATSSMVTELVKGKTVDEALKISNKAVAEALGGLPRVKMHCSVLAESALKKAIDDYFKKKGTKK